MGVILVCLAMVLLAIKVTAEIWENANVATMKFNEAGNKREAVNSVGCLQLTVEVKVHLLACSGAVDCVM